MWAQVINVLIGLALIIVPSLAGFNTVDANTNHIIGPLVVLFALTSVSEYVRNMRLCNIVCALSLIAASFIFSINIIPMIIDVIAGIFIITLSFIKGNIKKRYGGGWRSLFQTNPLHWQQTKKQ